MKGVIVQERQVAIPVASNFKKAMEAVGSHNTVTDAVWVLKNVDQVSRPLANNCLWDATLHGSLKQAVAYLKGRIRVASSKGHLYKVTANDLKLTRGMADK